MKSSSHEIIFKTATSGYFKKVWDKISSYPENLVSHVEGISRVKKEDFFTPMKEPIFWVTLQRTVI